MATHNLGSVYGVELEYMIVDRSSLDVTPIAEVLLGVEGEEEHADITWCNELVAHVVELKVTQPAASLTGLAAVFQRHVRTINALLEPHHAMLLPSAMHPWMDPYKEMVLWPHGYNDIYAAFDRIFDCRGHGWANLQSIHLNLPFDGDEEFARLHAAIRMVLPLIPAIAASSPYRDDRVAPELDGRLAVYKTNAVKIPSVSGKVIPESVFSKREYIDTILKPMYADIAPFDPDGILQEEWLNARGAIARFDRNAIEIRVTDIQECPAADLAVLMMIDRAVNHFIDRFDEIRDTPTDSLAALLDETIRVGGKAPYGNGTVLDFWKERLAEGGDLPNNDSHQAILVILERGTLAERLLRHDDKKSAYRGLAACLHAGTMFQ
jgi:glutamate---cysteine ligase / carboxylate-amine ligase